MFKQGIRSAQLAIREMAIVGQNIQTAVKADILEALRYIKKKLRIGGDDDRTPAGCPAVEESFGIP